MNVEEIIDETNFCNALHDFGHRVQSRTRRQQHFKKRLNETSTHDKNNGHAQQRIQGNKALHTTSTKSEGSILT